MTFDVLNLSADREANFDLFIFAVGYEKRARFIAEKYSARSRTTVGYVFADGHILSFEANMAFLKRLGGFELAPGQTLEMVLREKRPVEAFSRCRVAIDVSSLNRGAMADLLSELLDSQFFSGSEITVLYSVAEFEPPPGTELDFLEFGPLAGFDGWTTSPENPTALILGLGYEPDHAVGAFEYLDPSVTFAFSPLGVDDRFDSAVAAANKSFFDLISPERIVHYPVNSPYQTFWLMRSLLLSLVASARVVIVPMGPKVFCSLCLICQRLFGDEISVWRASGHTLRNARDAVASGEITGYVIRRPDSDACGQAAADGSV